MDPEKEHSPTDIALMRMVNKEEKLGKNRRKSQKRKKPTVSNFKEELENK